MLLFLLAAYARPPSPAQVGDRLARDAAEKSGQNCVFTETPPSVLCEGAGLTSLAGFLETYRSASRKERRILFETWLEEVVRPAEGVAGTSAEALRPMVKSRADFLNMSRQVRSLGAAVSIPTLPLTDTLAVSLALDGADAMRFASTKDLETLELSGEAGLRQAVTNLAGVPFAPHELVEGLHLVGEVDGYDSARFLVEDAFEPLGLETPLVLVAARDLLFVTDLELPGAIDRLLDVAFRTIEDTELVKRVSLIPIVRTSSGWEDLQLEATHPSYGKLQSLRKLQTGQWYHDQRAMLAETQPDLPVAELTGVRLPDGTGRHVISLEPKEALLPVAEWVGVVHEQVPRLVPWEAFVELAGEHATVEPGTWPVLHRVDGAALFADLGRFEAAWKTAEEALGLEEAPTDR